MKVLIAGSSGLIGNTLVKSLENDGHAVVRLIRGRSRGDGEIFWDPARGTSEIDNTEKFDAAINLAGANIGQRWTETYKQVLYDSRILTTKNLVKIISELDNPPDVLINASATGYYGLCGSEELNEDNPSGEGFLAGLCKDWENSAEETQDAGVRTVILRIGVVLDKYQGALAKMLPVFRLGLGGKIGNGHQYMSWISLDDLVEIFKQVLTDQGLEGTFNATSPNPVTNSEFTSLLSGVLRRPSFFPVPAFVLKLIFGEMADETILASQRVIPDRLIKRDFEFKFPGLREALKNIL